jgi:hypothetical protein
MQLEWMVVTEHTEQHGKPIPYGSTFATSFSHRYVFLLAARQITTRTCFKLRRVQRISAQRNNGNVAVRNVTIPQPNIWPNSVQTEDTKPESICSL